jgi:hypothetical protein
MRQKTVENRDFLHCSDGRSAFLVSILARIVRNAEAAGEGQRLFVAPREPDL